MVPVLCALSFPTATSAEPPAGSGGYWLGAQLLGPEPAVLAATEAMSFGTAVSDPPAGGGAVVGQVEQIHDALRFVARWAFPAGAGSVRERTLQLLPAPVPGGDLYTVHGAILHALTVQGRSESGGKRTIQWPKDQAALLPDDLAWQPAALIPDRAPLFAAPAPRLPPAGERHALVRRAGGLFVLGALDRCDAPGERPGERECLRWYQVVARDGDRFLPGYLPAFQVALEADWRRGQGALPRAQLIPSGTHGDLARFLLVARARDGSLHRLTLDAPLADGGFPEATLTVDGDAATVTFAGAAARRIALDATMDARPR